MPDGKLRERYLSAVVSVQQMLLSRTAGQYFENVLPVLVAAADADRCYIFENYVGSDGAVWSVCRAEWCRPGIPSDESLGVPLNVPTAAMIPEVMAALGRGGAVHGHRDELPAALQPILQQSQVESLVLLPIHVHGKFQGFLGYDNCSTPRTWLSDEIDLMRAACGAIAADLERAEAETRLGATAQRLSHHVESTPLAVVEWDQEFRVIFWSARAERIFGWTAADVLGKRWSDWRFVVEGDHGRVAQVAVDLTSGSTPYSISINDNYTKSGGVRSCEWYNSALRDETGRVTSTLSLVLDVTERVRAEEQVRRSQSRVAHAEKMAALGQMAAGVAHDFNNALTVILGKAEILLMKYGLSDSARAIVEEIRYAGYDAANTVKRMQQFVRSRQSGASNGGVDLSALAAETAQTTRDRLADGTISSGGLITVATELKGRVPVRADAGDLSELLNCLVNNAIEAMPEGGILTLSTSVTNGRIFLRVRDTGVGMDEDTRHRCFEPFFTTRGVDRSGLGLAICWSIAQRNGGEVQVESAPGQGSCFSLRLPCDSEADRS